MMVLVIIEKNISSHDEKFAPHDGVGDQQKISSYDEKLSPHDGVGKIQLFSTLHVGGYYRF